MRCFLAIVLSSLAIFTAVPAFAETFLGINYIVIENTHLGNIKGSIDIRLEKKVTKEFLEKMALELRESEPRSYERLFITYYLPGMVPGSGAWATSHFNPDLEIKILGLTIEDEQILKSDTNNISGEIIGEWLDESPFFSIK